MSGLACKTCKHFKSFSGSRGLELCKEYNFVNKDKKVCLEGQRGKIKLPKVTKTVTGNFQYFKEKRTGLVYILLEDYIVNMTDGNVGQVLIKYRSGTTINSSPALVMDRSLFFDRFASICLEDLR